MPEPILNNRHAHSPDYWSAGEKEKEDRKFKIRLRILLAAIIIAALIFILCIILTIGKAQVRGYIPTLILELDLSPIGKDPIVLGTIKLPEIQQPFPDKLDFPGKTFEQNIAFAQSFSPTVKRRVEYEPVFKSCLLCLTK